jgi:O-antigen ligase
MTFSKPNIIKYTDFLILIFLSFHVIGSQYSVALSSIGLGGLIILASFRLSFDRDVFKPDKKLVYVFLLLIIAQVIASIFSVDPLDSFYQSKRVFLYAGFFTVIIFVKDLKQLANILKVFFVFTALLSTYELIKYFIEYSQETDIPLSELRLEFYGYPITNGEIKMLILLLMITLTLTRDKFVFSKLWIVILSIPVLLSLYFTNSRNAMIGLFSGIVFIGFTRNKYFLIGVIVFVILFLLLAPLPIKERVLSITDFSLPSTQARFLTWETGVKLLKDYPITGIGDTDVLKMYRSYKYPEYEGEGSHMHNNFLQILVTIGIIGFLAWCIMMVYVIIRMIKIYSLTKGDTILNSLVVASISSMIAFQISGLTEYNFSDFEFAAVMWFMFGLAFLAEKLYNYKESV